MLTAKRTPLLLAAAAALLLLVGCQKAPSATASTQPSSPPAATPAPISPTPAPPTATSTPKVLPPDPQRITFEGEHGTMVGYYYPAAEANAPVIVLMHWARGDQRDWCLIAPWLQNRAAEKPALMPGCEEAIAKAQPLPGWWDASWFPPMPQGTSYAVFTFDFPGFGESKGTAYTDTTIRYRPSRQRDDWNISTQDLLAAMKTAAALPGVDANRVIAIGASIGANGATNGCAALNQAHQQGEPGQCIGAWAISPGDYHLGAPFVEASATLAKTSLSVVQWCTAAFAEQAPCKQAKGSLNQTIIFPKGHGMAFFEPNTYPMKPGRDATIMDFLQEFLEALL